MPASIELILASGSPRRQELLQRFGHPFRIITSGVPEDLDPNDTPVQAVRWLARLKAESVAETLPSGLVIGADTIVVLDGVILGKPVDAADAEAMLRSLRGKPHQVITGVAVCDAAAMRSVATSAVTTHVIMNGYSDAQIHDYVQSGEPMDKAGSYAIQGLGGAFVDHIDGCYNNVVGFPLCETAALLEGFGVQVNRNNGPICQNPDGSACARLR